MELTTEQKRQVLCDMLQGGKGDALGVITPFPAEQVSPAHRYYFLWRCSNNEDITRYCFDTVEHAEQMLRWFQGIETLDI